MSHASAMRLLVLHGVRLKGFTEASTIAELWPLDESTVAAELTALEDEGLIQRRDGRVSGWTLTAEGRTHHAALLEAELEEAGARPAVDGAYRRFLRLNPELLGVCTAWQLRTADGVQILNDHADPVYDAGVVQTLVELHEECQPLLEDLTAALARFGRYPERLDHAVTRVQEGDWAWFTRPLLDSYHTVWFELHEDLLSTLGLQRGSEATMREH